MVTNQSTGKLNIGTSSGSDPVSGIKGLFSRGLLTAAKGFINISFTDLFMIVVIAMLIVATPATAFVMGKDAERNISVKAAEQIAGTIAPTANYFDKGLKATLELLKLDRAPTVVGLKEADAMKKLETAKVEPQKINVSHEKLTYPALVEKSNTLFFGEVESQKVSTKGISLNIVEADLEDPFTAQMNAMGSRLAWPVPGNERISSGFGGRASPGGIGSTNHQGIDIPAPTGKPIIAVKTGKVESAGRMGGYGNCVVVDHQNGFKSLYGHMSRITCNAGDTVDPGDVIGNVGSTGWSTGPHLHFGLIKDGTFIDPEPFFTGKENINAGDEVSINNTTTDDPNATEASDPDSRSTDRDDEENSSDSNASSSGGSSDSSGSSSDSQKPTVKDSSGSSSGSGGKTTNSGGNKPTPGSGSNDQGGGSNTGGNSSSGDDTGGGNPGSEDPGSGDPGGGDPGGGETPPTPTTAPPTGGE